MSELFKRAGLISIWVLALVVLHPPVVHAFSTETRAEAACQKGEAWRFSREIPRNSVRAFGEFLAGKQKAMRSFAQALSFRRAARAAETRMFAEYWAARTLLEAGNLSSAAAGFTYLAGEYSDSSSVGIQIAALDCLNHIRLSYPALVSGAPLVPQAKKLLALTDEPKQLRVLWRFAGTVFRELLATGAAKPQLEGVLSLLDGAGTHEYLARGLYAASNGDNEGTLQNFKRIGSRSFSGIPELARMSDRIHLLTARALYSTKRFPEAIERLKKIEKNSNELVNGLSELGWAALQAGRYPEAIGASLSLQSGGLRRTFAPEGPMIMAMALNEMCQYPESLRATEAFRKTYESTYQWLAYWNSAQRKPEMYGLVLDYIKKRKSAVPDRISSEWVRSPVFIASQEELNLLAKERSRVTRESKDAAREQKVMGRDIQRTSVALLAKLKDLRTLKKSPELLKTELMTFRSDVAEYRDFRRAASAWRNIVKNSEIRDPVLSRALVARIENDLGNKNYRMLKMLEEIAENNQLIEAEIYHGASKDIIWQNAHPDYRKILAGIGADRGTSKALVWEWGRGSPLAAEWSEIWEDEVGSFKADLPDNCSSKQKYLAIKRLLPDAIKKAQARQGAKP
ncbi:MAG: hypothetical protein A2070_05955 [Bdellovibrionales bacterium GWC1_52_8]|nr:MAG: hypothetical protein A2Z97_08200 [Bdellovibrionales bacterium GWB1_52_6]OFZ03830.1 MAG: hypothetical protein A2X97_15640 [Bdellovibrionales bacterium GWA1_52_35]OFZ39622.1 MAG: hypothetical protein A2070_05955 [Bdellovibrionales bacterium GWC1_52_8]HCM39735.1 hypothetical protein [Bdellovibrionales bacterium]